MSWDGHVASLTSSGHIHRACIVSAAGDSVWATTEGFNVTGDELKQIVAVLNEPDKTSGEAVSKAYSDGLHVAGKRYVATRIEDRHIYGRQGTSGICIVKTKLTILIGQYDEPVIAGNATRVVENMADQLISQNY